MKNTLTIVAGWIAGVAILIAAGPAAARVDVGINIGIPGIYPAPVYVEPQPVYVQPQPVYVQPQPVYVQPQPVYIERERGREWRERQWRARQWRERHEHRDEYRGYRHGEHRGHTD